MDLSSIDWKTSSRCGPNAQCVEVGLLLDSPALIPLGETGEAR
jgi:Domain of unknown function (DUF397)